LGKTGPELRYGKIDRQCEFWNPLSPPVQALEAGAFENLFVNCGDQAVFFGNGNEIIRRYQPFLRMNPADKGLKANEFSAFAAKLGLIVNGKLFLIDGYFQLGLK